MAVFVTELFNPKLSNNNVWAPISYYCQLAVLRADCVLCIIIPHNRVFVFQGKLCPHFCSPLILSRLHAVFSVRCTAVPKVGSRGLTLAAIFPCMSLYVRCVSSLTAVHSESSRHQAPLTAVPGPAALRISSHSSGLHGATGAC